MAKKQGDKPVRKRRSEKKDVTKKDNKVSAGTKKETDGIAMSNEISVVASAGIMLLMVLSNFNLCGTIGIALSSLFFGIFGCVQYVMPVAFLAGVLILLANDYSPLSIKKCLAGFSILMIISAFAQLIYMREGGVELASLFSLAIKNHATGGLIGGGIATILFNGFGVAGAAIILFCCLLLSFVLMTQKSFVDFMGRISGDMKEKRAEYKEIREQTIAEEDARDEAFYSGEKDRPAAEAGPEPEEKASNEPVVEEVRPEGRRARRRRSGTKDEKLDEKLREMEEDKKKKGRSRKDDTKGGSRVDVPLFTSSDEVKKKDSVTELHPQIYPLAEEDARTEPFEQELDFSAFDYGKSKEDPKEFLERMPSFAKSMEELKEERDLQIPPHKSKGGFEAGDIPEAEYKEVGEQPEVPEDEADAFLIIDEAAPGEDGADMPADLTRTEPDQAKDKAGVKAGDKSGEKPLEGTEKVHVNRAPAVQAVGDAKPRKKTNYIFPPMSLLEKGSGDKISPTLDQELKETAVKLQQTLESFDVNVTITNVSCGPTVTRYELVPERGTKVSKIQNLSDDIKLNLAAKDIRIEAPIPGKAAIGIEVPNKEKQTVFLRDIIDNRAFHKSKAQLGVALGKDIGGKIVMTDLVKMPHLLIAGATGSGKSVCINTIIACLLYKYAPDEVKMIMVDPKMVELSVYNGIPHLLIPVVTDPKKAAGALNWAVAEMTDRYKKFAETGVRNIEGYNKKVEDLVKANKADAEKLSRMPKIVIIIDELADLMMVAPGEVEEAIVRITQLARAAGIHLILATQRPSVNVITGLIKANVPSRLALKVSSSVDSRTILDGAGAEKLLGDGDMLFHPTGMSKPLRLQGAYLKDEEIASIVEFLKENAEAAEYDVSVTEKIEKNIKTGGPSQERDEYFEAAARFFVEKDRATIGMLQRMFKIGFNRAARIVDQLADAGIVGPEEGTKARKVLMSPEELDEFFEQGM